VQKWIKNAYIKKTSFLLSTCDYTSSQVIANYLTYEVVCMNFLVCSTHMQ